MSFLDVRIEANASAPLGGTEAAPGQPAQLRAQLRNTSDRPCAAIVSVIGLDPTWGATPRRVDALGAGDSAVVAIPVTPPVGSPAGRYPFVLSAQPIDAGTGMPIGSAVQLDGTLVVGDTSGLSMSLTPAEPRGVRGRRVTIDLDNRGTTPVSVTLDTTSSAGLSVRLSQTTPTVAAGQTASVRARLRVDRARLFGQTRRLPFVLTAQGRTTPQRYDGVFVARPMFGRMATRALALVVVIALWGAAAFVAVDKISSRAHQNQNLVAQAAASGSAAPSSPAPSGSGGAGGSGSTGGSGGSATGANVAASTDTARVNGTVTGAAPGGVTVTLAPTSLVDEATEGATFVGVSTTKAPVGKLSAELVSFTKPTAVVSTTLSTQTQADGSWAFAGVRTPGYYLLTFSKPGYQTKRYVINPTAGADPTPLTVPLVAGDGHLSGSVSGPDGPLGGVDLTITDGTVTIATTTPTTGSIGDWKIDGISTPGTYLVSASRLGFGTESTLVTLPAGGSLDAVDLTLHPGVESLVGTVSAPDDSGTVAGIGDVTVSVTNGKVTRTATTVTTGPVGHYALPQLPVPSTYTLTITGDGFATRTAQVELTGDAPEHTVDALLSPSTATVTGTVTASGSAGLVGAGIVLTGDNGIYKTTTVSDPAGGFRMTGVVPGSYVLSAQKFGYVTQYAQVNVVMGTPIDVSVSLPAVGGEGLPTTSHVRGRVTDSRTGGEIACPPPNDNPTDCVITATTIDRRSTGPVTVTSDPTPADQEYVLPAIDPGNPSNGLLPGLHAITVSAPGYESQTIMVQVPLGATVEAPPVALAPAATITGTLSTVVDALPAGTCVIVVPLTAGSAIPPCTPAAPPALTCTTTVANALCAVADSNGVYTVSGVPHGSYYVDVVPTNAEYLPVTPIQVTVASGETRQYSTVVNRLGRLTVTVLKPDANGTPVAASGETVTVNPGNITSTPTDTFGQTTVTGLAGGSYTIDVTDGPSSASTTVSVGLNQTATVTTVLVAPFSTIRGRVIYRVDGTDHPVPNASVIVTGVVGYIGTVPFKISSTPVTADANGCFAITPDGVPPADDGAGGPCDGAGLPTQWLPVATKNVDVSATATGYTNGSQTGLAIQTDGSLTIVMEPPGHTVSGTVTASTGGVDLSNVKLQVTAAAPGSGTINLSSDATGTITWIDSAEQSAPNVARPGTYTLRASLPGYDDATTTFTVPVATDGSTFSFNLALQAYGSLRINAVDSGGVGVPDAVYILTGTGISATTLSAPPGGTNVLFPNLSPTGSYSVEVRAPGYRFATSASLAVTPGATATYDVTLARDGAVVGTVSGSASGQTYPLNGATVKATNGTSTFTTVTGPEGQYRLTGTTTTQGLDADDWTVSVSMTGYNNGAPSTQTVTIPAGGGDVTQNFTLTADPVTLVVTVQPSGVSGATVTLQNAGGTLSPTSHTGQTYTFAGIDPVQYSLQIVAPNYAPLSTSVTLQAGIATQTAFVTLAARTNSMSGTVSGQRGTEPTSALSGATVDALDSSSNVVATTTTDSSGGYQLDGIPDGTYTFRVSMTGYAPQTSAKLKLQSGQIGSFNATLALYSHKLTVNVKSSLGGVSMDGAQVTLTPTGSTGVAQGPQAVGTGGSVMFPQVYTDTYTVTVSGPTGHYGTTFSPTSITVPANATDQVATITVSELELKIKVTANPADTTLSTTVTVAPSGGGAAIYTGAITADGTEHDVFVDSTKTYKVTASATGYADATYTTTAGDTTDAVALTVVEPGSLTVNVTDGATPANPVGGASVSLSGGPSSPPDGTTDVTGAVTFSNLSPGSYTITVTTSDTPPLSGTGSGTVTAGGTATVPITVS